jgi:hypothetical protein
VFLGLFESGSSVARGETGRGFLAGGAGLLVSGPGFAFIAGTGGFFGSTGFGSAAGAIGAAEDDLFCIAARFAIIEAIMSPPGGAAAAADVLPKVPVLLAAFPGPPPSPELSDAAAAGFAGANRGPLLSTVSAFFNLPLEKP